MSKFYTRLVLGGRGPLWGIGVMSWIALILIPLDTKDRIDDSRPDPIPLMNNPNPFIPIILAFSIKSSATFDAA